MQHSQQIIDDQNIKPYELWQIQMIWVFIFQSSLLNPDGKSLKSDYKLKAYSVAYAIYVYNN